MNSCDTMIVIHNDYSFLSRRQFLHLNFHRFALSVPQWFLVFTHVMRRPCWCTKQWQNVAQVLRNNRIKFPTWPLWRRMKTERSRQRQRNLAQHFLSIRNINLIYLPTCKTTRNKKQNISKQTSSRSGLSVCDSKAWLMKPWLGSSSLLCNWLKSGFVAPGDDLASSSSWAGNSYSAGVLFASGVT